MSGFWIKWDKGLTRKPEILQISARLHMPVTQAAGTLMLLMEWLDDNVHIASGSCPVSVRLKSLSYDFIDALVGVSGFSETLKEVGWIRVEGDSLVFVNAERHNGTTAKSRALDADRKRKGRSGFCPDNVRVKTGRLCSVSVSTLSSVMKDQLNGAPTPNEVYAAYPRKVGKNSAIKAICRVVSNESKATGFLLERVQAYADAVSKWPETEKQFIPHPATWFNRGSYDDDPATWEKTPTAKTGQRSMGFAHE